MEYKRPKSKKLRIEEEESDLAEEEEIDDVAEKEDMEEENENQYSKDDYHDSSEDELMCNELVRLVASKEMAEPL